MRNAGAPSCPGLLSGLHNVLAGHMLCSHAGPKSRVPWRAMLHSTVGFSDLPQLQHHSKAGSPAYTAPSMQGASKEVC